jgi:hypothetical protein
MRGFTHLDHYFRSKAGIGLLLIFVLAAAEYGLEHTGIGHGLERQSYRSLNAIRSQWFSKEAKAERVEVVDISAIGTTGGSDEIEPYTSPVILRALISQLSGLNPPPLAIGVDVDLSPVIRGNTTDGWSAHVPEGFAALMQLASELNAKQPPVRVFFGADRTAQHGPEHWLMDSAWSAHATWLRLPSDRNFAVPLHFQSAQDQLPSLSFALAEVGLARDGVITRKALNAFETRAPDVGQLVPQALNDLALLKKIKEGVVACDAQGQLNGDGLKRLQPGGKIILLGQVEKASDRLVPPGEHEAEAGVLFHAAGVATLWAQDLRRFPALLGLILGMLMMGGLWWRHHYGHPIAKPDEALVADLKAAWRGSLLWATVAVILALAFLVVGYMWLELFLVLIFAAIHAQVENFAATRFADLAAKRRAALPALD